MWKTLVHLSQCMDSSVFSSSLHTIHCGLPTGTNQDADVDVDVVSCVGVCASAIYKKTKGKRKPNTDKRTRSPRNVSRTKCSSRDSNFDLCLDARCLLSLRHTTFALKKSEGDIQTEKTKQFRLKRGVCAPSLLVTPRLARTARKGQEVSKTHRNSGKTKKTGKTGNRQVEK